MIEKFHDNKDWFRVNRDGCIRSVWLLSIFDIKVLNHHFCRRVERFIWRTWERDAASKTRDWRLRTREMIFRSCNVKVQSDLIIAFIEQPPFAHNMRKKWVALLASPYTESAIIARYPSLKYVNPPHPSPTAADSTRFELNSSLSSTFLIVSWNRALCNF